MGGEWREVIVEEIKAKTENALATGPFGSSIGSRFFSDFGVPIIRGSNLSENIGIRLNDQGLVFLSPSKAQEFSRSKVRDGDLIFTCWGTVNQVGLLDRRATYHEYIISNKQMKLTPDPAKVDSLFLYYLFSSPELQNRIKNQSIGSSVPGFNLGQLRTMRIRIPNLEEQHTISHILGTLDDKIELNRRMNETLESMACALFKSWFIDFDPVRAKAEGRDPVLPKEIADLLPNRFEDSELGEIPKGWEVLNVNCIGDVICGKTPSTKILEFYGDDIPFITIPDMHQKIFATKVQRSLSLAGAISQKNKMLPAGALCVSCIATPGLVVITSEPSQTNQQINSVVPASSNETYFWFWIFHELGVDIRAGGSGGSVLNNLSTGRFSELPVLFPPPGLRTYYHLLVAPLFNRILVNDRGIATLAALRDTLLTRFMSGELRVTEA